MSAHSAVYFLGIREHFTSVIDLNFEDVNEEGISLSEASCDIHHFRTSLSIPGCERDGYFTSVKLNSISYYKSLSSLLLSECVSLH